MNDKPTLYVLDGSYYVFRAFYAVQGMTNGRGLPTNGVFAFTNMLFNLIRDKRPNYLVVTFDPPGPTFRNEIFADYKANRSEPPADLVPQFPWFRRVVESLGIPVLEQSGMEADDMIGSIVKRSEREGIHVTILSGDKDLFQLVDDHTIMIDTMRDKVVDIPAVIERFGVPPALVPDVLALSGDTSDNIPGVPGIGEKTGGKLIAEFGSLENLLANIDRVAGEKKRENLREHTETARRALRLTTIKTDIPIEVDLDFWRLTPPDFEQFDAICVELNFTRFRQVVRELFPAESREVAMTRADDYDYVTVRTAEHLQRCVGEIRAANRLSFDLETTSVDPLEAEIVGFAMAWKAGHGVYVPVAHGTLDAAPQLDRASVLAVLKPLLEDATLPKYGQHTKYEEILLARNGVRVAGVAFDTMLAAYLIDPNRRRYGLDALAQEYLNHRNIAFSDVAGSGRDQVRFDQVPVADATRYASEDADVTLRLVDTLAPMLDAQNMRRLHDEVELPLSSVLARMEMTGVRVDTALLGTLSREFRSRLDEIEARIYDAAGMHFSIASPKQMAFVLFEKLGLPVIRKTKTGPSTDQAVLEELRSSHPVVDAILEHRQLAKLLSTYIDALPKLVRADSGRVHTDYHQAVAATGRLSSSEPNLQNIPIRTFEGKRIRAAFIPEPGWILFGADYSQIELRLLAHMAEEPVLIDAFVRGEDIHRRTAAEVFGVEQEDVTPAQRGAAKTINFGVIYGMGAMRLADELGISRGDARDFIQRYFDRVSRVKPFFDKLISDARHNGYAETLIGRRRPIPELQSGEARNTALGERLAVNTPIQGTAADVIKLAMINISRSLSDRSMKTRMLLQVHDELVLESPPDELETAMALVREGMEGAMALSVPLRVEMSHGPNWAALK
jgi:DNA polymerase-1